MKASTSTAVLLRIFEYSNKSPDRLLEIVRNVEKGTGARIYTWKTDYENKLNSEDFWKDIDLLRSIGNIDDNGITETGKTLIEKYGLELPEKMKEFLESNYGK